jgi:regulator of protease activity HflC (stomatin/prohibitin superfamily)
MNNYLRFSPLLLVPLILLVPMTSCTRVEPGHVGIKVNNFGSAAGVSGQALGVGWYFTPFGTNIYEYPIYTSTYAWTSSRTEQTQNDESFNFQDKNGLNLSADVSVAYRVDPVRAPILFQKYRTWTGSSRGRCATPFAARSSRRRPSSASRRSMVRRRAS